MSDVLTMISKDCVVDFRIHVVESSQSFAIFPHITYRRETQRLSAKTSFWPAHLQARKKISESFPVVPNARSVNETLM